ncbi:hypothetical protein GC197_14580 [bacterium]|nr:hypothetical protein [bacterium]
MLGLLILSINVLLPGCSVLATEQSYGQLTVTEDLIRQEIIRLGGDWESGAKPTMVCFLGKKFESRHFEMLTHLPSVKFFHTDGCPIDQFAFACLSQVRQLERLDIKNCRLASKGISLLQANRELKELRFESVIVSDELIEEVGTIKHLNLVVFSDCKGMTHVQLKKLKIALPDAIVEADLP